MDTPKVRLELFIKAKQKKTIVRYVVDTKKRDLLLEISVMNHLMRK